MLKNMLVAIMSMIITTAMTMITIIDIELA
jgi:hypothetical protein